MPAEEQKVEAAPQQQEASVEKSKMKRPYVFQYTLALVIAGLTALFAWRCTGQLYGGRSVQHVWWYGWVTALSTGFGALPLAFCSSFDDWWLGAANALAAGMMTAASIALVLEGAQLEVGESGGIDLGVPAGVEAMGASAVGPAWQSALCGMIVGVVSIVASQRLISKYDDAKLGILDGVDARKALLILVVMTIHSFSEGIGIGVSFGEQSTHQLGMMVTTTLAVHNVPEGFAISVVLVSRGMSVLGAALWSICTSLPQPIMAIAGFHFVDSFALLQPAGLGFAAGAMLWVAWVELVADAVESCGVFATASIGVAAGAVMWTCHELLS